MAQTKGLVSPNNGMSVLNLCTFLCRSLHVSQFLNLLFELNPTLYIHFSDSSNSNRNWMPLEHREIRRWNRKLFFNRSCFGMLPSWLKLNSPCGIQEVP